MSVTPARVIFDSAGDGAWNMAVDQALLMSAEQDGMVTLRLYAWAQPTLSLGYFQKHADRQLHTASATCPLVRRRSGGGAILHDQELTYSLAIPSSHRWSNQNSETSRLNKVMIVMMRRRRKSIRMRFCVFNDALMVTSCLMVSRYSVVLSGG